MAKIPDSTDIPREIGQNEETSNAYWRRPLVAVFRPGGLSAEDVVQHFRYNPGNAMRMIWEAHTAVSLASSARLYTEAIRQLEREIALIDEQLEAGNPSEF